MTELENCPCCSGMNYQNCCQPFHQGKIAPTAEKLMRSRYCAYSLCIPDYLIKTTYPAKRKGLNEAEIIEWSKENRWVQLEIVSFTNSVVEFKAHFQDATGTIHVHHERSTFALDKGRWYYVKGEFY